MFLDSIKKLLGSRGAKNVACFVDGPNILRKEFNVSLSIVLENAQKFGKVKIARVFLDQFASDKLIEAVSNRGFEVVIVPSDIDVAMAGDVVEASFNEKISTIVIVSRDSDFKPVLLKAKERGKDVVVMGFGGKEFSSSLKNSADAVIELPEHGASDGK